MDRKKFIWRLDFVATIKFLTKEQGGRDNGIKSGYRPTFKIADSHLMTSTIIDFISKEIVLLGEQVTAEVQITDTVNFANLLFPGKPFELWEGSKKVGNGEILEMKNEVLAKQI